MATTLTGAWKRAAGGTRAGGDGRGWGRGPADPADPRHLTPAGDPNHPGGTDPNFTAPYGVPGIPGDVVDADPMIDGPAWRGPRVADPPIDRSAGAGHEQGIDTGTGIPERRARAEATAAHQLDAGAPRARSYAPRTLRAAGEQESTERREQLPISSGSTRQLRLYATSRAENLADSRNGYEIFRWVDRKFGYRWRRPDMPVLRTGEADLAHNSPPLGRANQYVSPFATLASGRDRRQMTPQVRRVPRPWDEEIITDGTAAAGAPAEFQSWGL